MASHLSGSVWNTSTGNLYLLCRPVQHAFALPHGSAGRYLTSLISLRGWSAAAARPPHGHAARWRIAPKIRVAAAAGSDVRTEAEAHATTAFGKVMQAQANFVRVRIDRLEDDGPPPAPQLLCVVRTLLKKIKQTVLVGDEVQVTGIDWADGRGMVQEVLQRRNSLSDPAIANIDQALMVFSLAQPPFEPANATRFLVTAEQAGIPVTLVLNKADLLPPEQLDAVVSKVQAWGYTPVTVSAHSGLGLQPLLDALVGKVSVLAGPSGVGKSSLLNALKTNTSEAEGGLSAAAESPTAATEPHAADTSAGFGTAGAAQQSAASPAEQRAALSVAGHGGADNAHEISTADDGGATAASDDGFAQRRVPWSAISSRRAAATQRTHEESSNLLGDEVDQLQAVGSISAIGRGKHTTRTVTLLPLRSGGLIADTPGFNQPALDAVTTEELPSSFPEIAARLKHDSCRFSNCQHIHEPGCAVRGEWERYPFYLEILEETKAKEDRDRHRSASKKAREGNTRVKSAAGGVVKKEALLDSNKHRKQSRKKINQNMQQAVYEQLDEDLDDYL